MVCRVRLDVRQGFEVRTAEDHLFPGVGLNGQLLALQSRSAEAMCQQQISFSHLTPEES